MSFHNTIEATGAQLLQFARDAGTQEQRILRYFERNRDTAFTPSEICERVFQNTVPLTSVRRGMSDLTAESKLIKTDTMRDGLFGKPEHAWKLATGQLKLI